MAPFAGPAPEALQRNACYEMDRQAINCYLETFPTVRQHFRQYAKDLTSRNVRLVDLFRYLDHRPDSMPSCACIWRGRPYPYVRGLAGEKTPTEILNLQPGELVQVRSTDEIMRTDQHT